MFDGNNYGNLNLDEFLIGVRGSLNAKLQEVVDRAFNNFNKDRSGTIEAIDLKGVYSAAKHPKVLSGEMTEN